MQEYIDRIKYMDPFLGGPRCNYEHACFASAVRHLMENIDNLHIAKSKCYVRFTSAWTMENMHSASKVRPCSYIFTHLKMWWLQAWLLPSVRDSLCYGVYTSNRGCTWFRHYIQGISVIQDARLQILSWPHFPEIYLGVKVLAES